MRKLFVFAMACLLVVAFVAGAAIALPDYAAATGKPCSFCHIDPRGGGPLTSAGQYYLDNGTLPPSAPAAPTGLAANAISSSEIDLQWTDASSDETGFKIERSASETGPFTLIATVGAGVTTYNNTGLSASTTYYYRVCATNAGGDSAYSNVASAATPAPPAPTIPVAPTGLTATAISSSRIDLQWADNSSDETGFVVERGSTASGPFTEVGSVAANVTAYSDTTGLAASTTYYYRVYATNAAGNSDYSNVASADTPSPPQIPAAPTGLAATGKSATQIDLQWTDASSDETGFKIERSSADTGPFTQIATVGAGVTAYSNTGLKPSTTYYYQVCATNAAGDSPYSNVASAATQAPPARKPAPPRGLRARAIAADSIALQWRAGSGDAAGFYLERSQKRTGPFTQIADLAAGVTSYTDAGLASATRYFYRICAYNAAGNSRYSGLASAMTPKAPPKPDEGGDDSGNKGGKGDRGEKGGSGGDD